MIEQARVSKTDSTDLPHYEPKLILRFHCHYVRLQLRTEELGRFYLSICIQGQNWGSGVTAELEISPPKAHSAALCFGAQ